MTAQQLDLFAAADDAELVPYWREQLRGLPAEVFAWRHHLNTTGWSVARSGWLFALWLYSAGQMTRAELRRWWRFGRRCDRWETRRGMVTA